jgi:RNA polymerase sigma-70 factor (ECF subfamily)
VSEPHEAVRPGDRSPARADEAVFEAIYPALRRYAAVVADLDVEPDDLVQDALASTLARHRLSDIDQPLAYLKRAVLNQSANRRRRMSVMRRHLPRLWGEPTGTDHYASDLAVLDVLGPLDRAALFLADVEGLPHAVVAEELGLTVSAVRKRVSRSRRTLRRHLSEPDGPTTDRASVVGLPKAQRPVPECSIARRKDGGA